MIDKVLTHIFCLSFVCVAFHVGGVCASFWFFAAFYFLGLIERFMFRKTSRCEVRPHQFNPFLFPPVPDAEDLIPALGVQIIMSIWRGFRRHLQLGAPQVIGMDTRALARQMRYWSTAASQREIHAVGNMLCSGNSGLGGLGWNNAQIPYHIQNFMRARRRFCITSVAGHGHIEPPKPGEEYVKFSSRELEKIHPVEVWG